MWGKHIHNFSFRESIKSLETDIQHANNLVAALPRDLAGDCVQMKLSYGPFAPFMLFLIEWMNWSCLDTVSSFLGLLHILVYKVYVDGMPTAFPEERQVTIQEFYSVIFPSLKQLEGNLMELMEDNLKKTDILSRKGEEENIKPRMDFEREDECGICMEMSSKVVLPNCGHSMCIGCFHDWYLRSQSCPFCRGCLNKVGSEDLWVLTSDCDVVDNISLAKENLRRFYTYIEKLPLVESDNNLLMYNYMM